MFEGKLVGKVCTLPSRLRRQTPAVAAHFAGESKDDLQPSLGIYAKRVGSFLYSVKKLKLYKSFK
jgi:hypothetical protein